MDDFGKEVEDAAHIVLGDTGILGADGSLLMVEDFAPGERIDVDGAVFYSVAGAAKLLGVNKRTIHYYMKDGRLPNVKRLGHRYVMAPDIRKMLTPDGE